MTDLLQVISDAYKCAAPLEDPKADRVYRDVLAKVAEAASDGSDHLRLDKPLFCKIAHWNAVGIELERQGFKVYAFDTWMDIKGWK